MTREAIWGKSSTWIRQNARLREPAIAGYRAVARTVLTGPPPKVFANSIPKSGTHLLSQLLGGVPRLWFCGQHLNHNRFRDDLERPGDRAGEFHPERLQRQLSNVRNGQFVTAHMAYAPAVSQVLTDEGFAAFLMVRDPRDLVVSLAHYLVSREDLPGYHELVAMATPGERLMACICGIPVTSRVAQRVPSIAERLGRYRGWLTDPATLVVRFEDLVGPRGGGSEEAQHRAVHQILVHCDRPAADSDVVALAARTFASHSATFRRGAIGDWRNHLGPEHEAALQLSAGDLMREFGYA